MTVAEMMFADEIDCFDLFGGNREREQIIVFVEWLKFPGTLRNHVKARAYHKEISLKCDKIVRKNVQIE